MRAVHISELNRLDTNDWWQGWDELPVDNPGQVVPNLLQKVWYCLQNGGSVKGYIHPVEFSLTEVPSEEELHQLEQLMLLAEEQSPQYEWEISFEEDNWLITYKL